LSQPPFVMSKYTTTEDLHRDAHVYYKNESEKASEKLERLEAFLHSRTMHPDYEYAHTEGPRKYFDEDPPEGSGWFRNNHIGRDGWERFDYHEEAYWMRLKNES